MKRQVQGKLLEPVKKKEKPPCYLEVEYTDEVAALVSLSVLHNLELKGLLYLWEKYGKDVWLFFFMFAGRDIKLPKMVKYERLHEFSGKVREAVMSGRVFDSAIGQEREAYLAQKRLFDGKNSLIIEIEEGEAS